MGLLLWFRGCGACGSVDSILNVILKPAMLESMERQFNELRKPLARNLRALRSHAGLSAEASALAAEYSAV